jgi:hypothetical protein
VCRALSQVTYAIVGASTNSTVSVTLANVGTVLDLSASGLLTVKDTALFGQFIQHDAVFLTVTATDGTARSTTLTLVVVVSDGNFPPTISSGQSRTVAENSAVGFNLGAPVAAADRDDTVLSYEMSATSSNPIAALFFGINAATGQISVVRVAASVVAAGCVCMYLDVCPCPSGMCVSVRVFMYVRAHACIAGGADQGGSGL